MRKGYGANTGADFNRYAYARNDPLNRVDRNGKWPTTIHEEIIDQAFPGLSQRDRTALKSASARMDQRALSQTKLKNHEHFMKSPGEDPQKATAGAKDSIAKFVDRAKVSRTIKVAPQI